MKHILPTHTCFDDALDMLTEAIKANPGSFESDELKLVHGVIVPYGKEFAHAWVESYGKIVWFMGIVKGERHQFAADVKEYYADMKVKETTKYTPREAWKMNEKFVTFGPWEEKYLKLCGNRSINSK